MVDMGGTFASFDSEIPVPEPGSVSLALVALGSVGLLARRRRGDAGQN